jgi:hypothetical protein
MGGVDNVVKIYNYLYTPLSEKNEKKSVSGGIVCIIDTDNRPVLPEKYKSIKGILTLRRIDLKSNEIKLMELNQSSERNNTVIEDLLDANLFYSACTSIIQSGGSDELKDLISHIKVSEGAIFTGFSKGLSSVEGTTLEGYKRKKELIDFISQHEVKHKIATKYVEIFNESGMDSPTWISDIVDLFETNS